MKRTTVAAAGSKGVDHSYKNVDENNNKPAADESLIAAANKIPCLPPQFPLFPNPLFISYLENQFSHLSNMYPAVQRQSVFPVRPLLRNQTYLLRPTITQIQDDFNYKANV